MKRILSYEYIIKPEKQKILETFYYGIIPTIALLTHIANLCR